MIPFKNRWVNLLAAVILLTASYFLSVVKQGNVDAEKLAQKVSAVLKDKHQQLQDITGQIASSVENKGLNQTFKEQTEPFKRLYAEDGIGVYVYKADSLILWSTNQIPVPVYLSEPEFIADCVKLKNGWYTVEKTTTSQGNVIALALIQHEYPHQNQYLQNSFHKDFGIGKSARIIPLSNPIGAQVKGKQNQPAFNIVPASNQENGALLISILLVIASIAGIYFLVVFLLQECLSLQEYLGKRGSIFLFGVAIIGLRAASLLLKQPASFYNLPVFSPNQYAVSAFLPSLGDLLLHAFTIVGLVLLVHKYVHFNKTFAKRASKISKLLFAGFFVLLGFGLSLCAVKVVQSLITNSSISFNVNNLFELNIYSYVGIGIMGIFFFAMFLLIDKAVGVTFKLQYSFRFLAASTILPSILVFASAWAFASHPITTLALPLSVTFIVGAVKKYGNKQYSFQNIIVLLFVYSLFSAFFISVYANEKEKQERNLLIEKLAEEEDPIAELQFSEMNKKLQADKVLINALDTNITFNKEEFDKQLSQQYFNGYFTRYSVKSYVFLANGKALAASDADKRKHKKQYFESLVRDFGNPTISSNFYHIENPEESETYLAKIPIRNAGPSIPDAAVYIALESKLIPEEIGFPDLLLDGEEGYEGKFKDYAFAKYEQNKLVGQYGNYRYPMRNHQLPDLKTKKFYADFDGYSHLIYNASNDLMVVLSREKEGVLADITKFSYLFAFFGVFLLAVIILRNASRGIEFNRFTVTAKVQLMMVMVILISLVLFGIGTSYYINIQYAEKNNKNIREKINSVLIEVEHKLGEEDKISDDLNYMQYILAKFSSVFFTDINLYDLNGNLLASSRQQLFSEGLLSRKMNAEAYNKMSLLGKSQFVHQEKIGALAYLSAYVPFKNQSGEVLAYLNLPYFAKQSELENEISSFLVALINIYVFLFALSVVAALFISSIITEPLRFIQNRLSSIELGKTNSPILYEGDDEIGSLVKVYNEKVQELQQSAELLAKSERESAWREMAKQVAHEIKNPLTPMKLSVQHLQRSINENKENLEERIERFSKTLIEQIDSLSSIATAFSDFAKMPTADNQEINIKQTLLSAIDIFEETPHVTIEFENYLVEDRTVFADKDQLLRVFNNLLKNAIQAIPEENEGKVIVRLTEEKEDIIVEIEDNGTGISTEKLDKIFVPNFTTKTSGMGLGLAMVKNIIDNINGVIWFETQEGKGTTFYIKIPVHKG